MAELKGIYKRALLFSQQYAYIINNGVKSSFRTPLSALCENIIRIYDLDTCDYMKHFQNENIKFVYLFTQSKEDIYRTIKYEDCIFIVVPTAKLFSELDNEEILKGILNSLHVILDFANIMKYGSPTELYKAIFASYYFMVYVFCSCYDLDDKVKQSISKVINSEFGDICSVETIIKALTCVKEEKVPEYAAELFTNHTVLSYMDKDSLKILTTER